MFGIIDYGMTPAQLNYGIQKLWDAMPEISGPVDTDVFTVSANEITCLRKQRDELQTELAELKARLKSYSDMIPKPMNLPGMVTPVEECFG